jgi:putative flippase GtrA
MRIQLNTKLNRYVFSGATSAAVNLSLTWGLERIGMHYIAVVTVAFACSVIVSFVLQKFFTFGNRGTSGTHRQFALFTVIAGINLAANDGLVYVQYDLLRFKHLVVAQAVASAIIAVYSYFMYQRLFRDKLLEPVAAPLDRQP